MSKLKCYCPIETEADRKIYNELCAHMWDATQRFNERNIIYLALQGSQNYGLAYENSDVDTKLILTPTFEDIALNKAPVSTTFIRKDNSHTDDKDIRLMFKTFLKQNVNFIEVLFTPYYIINSDFEEEWNELLLHREAIARYNPWRAVKAMYGVATNKFTALEKPFEGKLDVLAKYGYDPKQLHHLLRIKEFITKYIAETPYEECLKPTDKEYLIDIKRGILSYSDARKLATDTMSDIEQMKQVYCAIHNDKGDIFVENLLNEIQIFIMKKSLKLELGAI